VTALIERMHIDLGAVEVVGHLLETSPVMPEAVNDDERSSRIPLNFPMMREQVQPVAGTKRSCSHVTPCLPSVQVKRDAC